MSSTRSAPVAPGPLAVLPPDISGPRVRTGVLWFLLALAAATSGRWWTAALWSLVALAAGFQVVRVWATEPPEVGPDVRPERQLPPPATAAAGAVAGLAAAGVTVAAAYGTGLAGVALTALAVTCGVAVLAGRRRPLVVPVAIGTLLPAVAASSVVLAVRIDLWAGLFLIVAVSLYDAGSFVFGAEAKGPWAGPVAGVVGVLAVTFTMSTVQVPPFDRTATWIAGGALAVACVLGQSVASALLPADLPRSGFSAGALRRLDAYLLGGPVLVACGWLLGTS